MKVRVNLKIIEFDQKENIRNTVVDLTTEGMYYDKDDVLIFKEDHKNKMICKVTRLPNELLIERTGDYNTKMVIKRNGVSHYDISVKEGNLSIPIYIKSLKLAYKKYDVEYQTDDDISSLKERKIVITIL